MMTDPRNVCYRLVASLSRLTVHSYAHGLLSFLGHSPTFTARDFSGEVWFGDDTSPIIRLDVQIRADSLQLMDKVRPADRAEIEYRMQREVLEIDHNPEIEFEGGEVFRESVADNQYRLQISGSLALHGISKPLMVTILMIVFPDGIRLRGVFTVRQSDFGIRPVRAVGGTIQLKDELQVSFDFAALPPEGL